MERILSWTKTGEWSANYGSAATHKKVYIGKVTNYFTKISVAEIYIEAQYISKGDEILIIGETTGVYEDIIEELRVDLQESTKQRKASTFLLKPKN